MIRIPAASLNLCFATFALAQAPPAIEWQRNLGGSLDDTGASVEQTSDGGYILCGTTYSNNGDVSGNHGNGDIWVVKLSGTGDIEWQRCLGGSEPDNGWRALELPGGGYLVLGNARSNNGDVGGNHGLIDFWLARLDSNGILLWQRCYGGSLDDAPNDIKPTPDGGFIIVGESGSTDGDLTANAGFADYWVLKLDANFDIQWQRSYGGSNVEAAFAVAPTSDGGYVLNGLSYSNDGDVSGAFGLEDYWVLKLDAVGDIQWQRSCGGSDSDYGLGITELSDGSFMAVGTSYSENGDVSAPMGSNDSWSIRLSAIGQVLEGRSYGGSNSDSSADLIETSDGGSVYCASSESNDGDIPGNQGLFDAWIFRTETSGDILWNLTLGGTQSESFRTVTGTTDGGYVAIGQSNSNDGDVIGNNGGGDVWVVKFGTDPVGLAEIEELIDLEVFPNPSSDMLWVRSPFLPGAPAMWQILDAQGRLVATGSADHPSTKLNVAALLPGAYHVVLSCEEQRALAPFVKE